MAEFRLLCTGSRDWTDEDLIREAFTENPIDPYIEVVVIHGGATGADYLCGKVARSFGWEVREFPVDWMQARKTFGSHYRAAGPKRNARMLQESPHLCYAFHDHLDASRGTADMVKQARRAKVPVVLWSHVEGGKSYQNLGPL